MHCDNLSHRIYCDLSVDRRELNFELLIDIFCVHHIDSLLYCSCKLPTMLIQTTLTVSIVSSSLPPISLSLLDLSYIVLSFVCFLQVSATVMFFMDWSLLRLTKFPVQRTRLMIVGHPTLPLWTLNQCSFFKVLP